MRSTYCIACLTEYPVRKEDGPFRMLSCVRCAGGREALECSDCRLRFNARPGSVCPRCVENELARHSLYPGKGWKGPI